MSNSEKLVLLPMIRITLEEKDKLNNIIISILQKFDLKELNIKDLCECICENCIIIKK